MPNPISSNRPSTCDPSIASCPDSPPPAPAPSAAGPATVDVAPVVITGDAGSQELLRRYDASERCRAQEDSAFLACVAVPVAVKDGGISSAFLASINCGKELRVLSNCHDAAQALQSSAKQVIDDCHDRDGNVSASSSPNEIICEVTP
jgi:hypothetical protein